MRTPVPSLTARFLALAATVMTSPLASPALASDGQWSAFFDAYPLGVSGTLLHDTQRDRGVLVAGNEIWQLTLGATPSWTRLAVTATAPGGPFVYDNVRDRIVAIGYGPLPANQLELWEMPLGGATLAWSPVASVGAPDHWAQFTINYDDITERLVLYGGYTAPETPPTVLNRRYVVDLAFSPAPWTQITSGGVARYGHCTLYDHDHWQVVTLGGWTSSFNPIFALSHAGTGGAGAWVTLPNGPVTSPVLPAGAIDRARHRAIFRWWRYDLGTDICASIALDGSWTYTPFGVSGPHPGGTSPGTAIYDATRDRMILHGSASTDALWTLGFDASGTATGWTDYTPRRPPSIKPVALVGQRLLQVGKGGTGAYDSLSVVWELSLVTPEWTEWTQRTIGGTLPPPRNGASVFYDAPRDRLLLFGGADGSSYRNDLWSLSSGATPTWSPIAVAGTPPSSRAGAVFAYDATRDRLLLFGGSSPGVFNTDVWELSLDGPMSWAPVTPVGPMPDAMTSPAAMVDPVGDRLLVFGDPVFAVPTQRGWALPLSGTPTWEPLAFHPSATIAPAYDPARHRIVAADDQRRTWAMDLDAASAWTLLAPGGEAAPVTGNSVAFFDPTHDRVIVDGALKARTYALAFGGPLGVPEEPRAPMVELAPGAPNPARDAVTFAFRAPRAAASRLTIVDIGGRTVRRLPLAATAQGTQRWDLRDDGGRRVEAGLYFAVLDVEGTRRARRIAVLP